MMKHKVISLALAMSATAALPAMAAESAGLAMQAAQLAPADRQALEHAVMADRLARPAAYDVVAAAKGCRPDGWMAARSPEPNCSRELRALGAAGLLPMLSALALDWSPHGLSEGADRVREERALTVGMLEAIGSLRDTRARPVLHAMWQAAKSRPEALAPLGRQMSVARATAEAMGRLGGAMELAALEQHLRLDDPLFSAAVAGVGVCKRTDAAPLLVNALNAAKDETTQRWVIQAMGTLASSWSWQALGKVREQDALKVRLRVTEVLLPLLAKTYGESRERVVQSLQLADLPDLPARLTTLRATADATLQHDIDDLLGRVARAHAAH
jgi:hypothetical protein